jgi:hypothetical protein
MAAAASVAAPPSDAAQTPTAQYRFATGSRERFPGTFKDQSLTPAAGTQAFDLIDLAAGDYTAGVWLQVSCDTSANAATVAFNADAPWNALYEVQLLDPQGVPFHIYSGFELYLINVLGGYTGQGNRSYSPYYLATSGVGAGLGGSFHFFLRIPAELFPRDEVAALFNGSTAAQFRIRVICAPSTDIYATPPTTLAPVRLRVNSHGYVIPQTNSPSGVPYATTPPGGPIYQNWTKLTYNAAGAGNMIFQLNRKGFWLRKIIMVTRNTTLARINTLITGDIRFIVDNVDVFNGTWDLFREITWDRNRVGNGGVDLPVGVLDQNWAFDMVGFSGGETRDQYVPTSPGSIIEFRAVLGAAGRVDFLVNDVAPTQKAFDAGVLKG